MEIDTERFTKSTKKLDFIVTYDGKRVEVNKSKKVIFEIAIDTLIKKDGAKCRVCGTDKNLTIDHVVPWSLVSQFTGDNDKFKYGDYDNMEILCKRCNSFKGDRLDFTNPKTKEILLKYIKII